MKYDDAGWHYNEKFPQGSPQENSGTHIAMFLKWCFINGMASEMHLEEHEEAVNAVIDGNITATSFLFEHCDGKLTDEDFNDKGNAFAMVYYGDEGKYLGDFVDHFKESLFIEPEEAHDFVKFSKMVEKRWLEFQHQSRGSKLKWFQKLFKK